MKIDIISLIIGTFLGAIPTFLVTYIFYKRANKDNKKENRRLKKYIRSVVLETEKNIISNNGKKKKI